VPPEQIEQLDSALEEAVVEWKADRRRLRTKLLRLLLLLDGSA
jgi:hypothetical protein